MQQFNIDISQPRGPLVLYASQGDAMSRFFAVIATDNGAAYEPPAGGIYTVRFGAPGMPAGWYDTIEEVGGSTHLAVVVSGNTITVELAEQAVSAPGTNAVVLIISDATGYTLASWAFELQVAAVPGYDAPEATVYYNALSAQVSQVLASTTAAASSATLAESWAVGGTGTREGEDTNNAEYWAQQAQSIASGQLGWYETEQALQAAHPTGENGQWAIIGSTDTIWTWDSDTSAWVNTGSTADLSNYYTKSQADAAFATAAQGALAASAVQSVNGLSGPNPSLTAVNVGAAPAENGVNVYIHSRTGTVNNFVGTGPNGRAKMTADVQAGDTFTVNGAPVTAYMGTDDAAGSMADRPWNGKWVSFIVGDKTLNFNGGSSKMLLWSNENPYATFDAQEVTLDLSGFSHVIIDFVMRVTEFNECSVMVPSDCFQVVHQIEQYYSDYRKVTVSKSSVSFGPGGWYDISGKADHNDNGYMVPKRIYGVR